MSGSRLAGAHHAARLARHRRRRGADRRSRTRSGAIGRSHAAQADGDDHRRRDLARRRRRPLPSSAISANSFTNLATNSGPRKGATKMNKHISESDLATPKVTTGPLAGLAQDLCEARRGAGPARAGARDRAVGRRRRAAAAGLRHHRPLHRQRRRDRRREGPDARPHRMGEGARRRRGIRRPPDQAGRQRQRHRQAPRPRLPDHARSRCARSTASRSRNTNGPRPASSPRK